VDRTVAVGEAAAAPAPGGEAVVAGERWQGLAGGIAVPVAVSAVLGVGVWLAVRYAFPEAAGGEEPALWLRLVSNGYCQGMLATLVGGAVYTLLQLWGLAMEEGGWDGPRLAGHLTGRSLDLRNGLAGLDPVDREVLLAARRRREQQPLQFVIWVLPMLGFIGTVLGITEAIGGLGTIVGGGGADERSLGQVLGGLRFAFDTTLLGLAGTIPLVAGLHWIRARVAHADAVHLVSGRQGAA